jgi:hypothetical protein
MRILGGSFSHQKKADSAFRKPLKFGGIYSLAILKIFISNIEMNTDYYKLEFSIQYNLNTIILLYKFEEVLSHGISKQNCHLCACDKKLLPSIRMGFAPHTLILRTKTQGLEMFRTRTQPCTWDSHGYQMQPIENICEDLQFSSKRRNGPQQC